MRTLVGNTSTLHVQALIAYRGTAADTCAEVQKKYSIATELRDNIDILCNGATYPIFLKKLVPVFMKLLEGPPVFMSTYMEHVSYALKLCFGDDVVLILGLTETSQLRAGNFSPTAYEPH